MGWMKRNAFLHVPIVSSLVSMGAPLGRWTSTVANHLFPVWLGRSACAQGAMTPTCFAWDGEQLASNIDAVVLSVTAGGAMAPARCIDDTWGILIVGGTAAWHGGGGASSACQPYLGEGGNEYDTTRLEIARRMEGEWGMLEGPFSGLSSGWKRMHTG